MRTYYCTVHREEDQQFLQGQHLDAMTSHMVFDSGYDSTEMRDIVLHHPWKVIWIMKQNDLAKYGWEFDRLFGIPA